MSSKTVFLVEDVTSDDWGVKRGEALCAFTKEDDANAFSAKDSETRVVPLVIYDAEPTDRPLYSSTVTLYATTSVKERDISVTSYKRYPHEAAALGVVGNKSHISEIRGLGQTIINVHGRNKEDVRKTMVERLSEYGRIDTEGGEQ